MYWKSAFLKPSFVWQEQKLFNSLEKIKPHKKISQTKSVLSEANVIKTENSKQPNIPHAATEKQNISSYNKTPGKIKKELHQQSKSDAVILYNQGVTELSLGEKDQALLFFEKAFYNHFFFPAWQALKFLDTPVSFVSLVWHFIMGVYGIVSLILIWFLIAKKPSVKTRSKVFFFWILLLAGLSGFNIQFLKPKGRALKSFELKNAPLKGAFSLANYQRGESFVALKTQGNWVKIKTRKKQKGWILKKNLYFTQE